jgi:uncharacterized protein
MKDAHISKIACELGLGEKQVRATASLLDNDATVPFISRYRKEATGSLDEVAITDIRDRLSQLRELDKRRGAILKSLAERDLLDDELRVKIEMAGTMAELEDVYLPFKPKKRTRATIAVERGLQPLAEIIFSQDEDIRPSREAEKFVDPGKEVNSTDDALAGARDIIAAWINEDADARARLRELYSEAAILISRVAAGKEAEAQKYADYFEWDEPIKSIVSHRLLAIRRGENEGYLAVRVAPPEEEALDILEDMFVTGTSESSEQVREAVHDGYRRLLGPAMETEAKAEAKKKADGEAIRIFTENLRELLMAPPLGKKNILAIDPGYRTGCKVVCLNQQGEMEHHDAIYPHSGENKRKEAADEIKALCDKFKIKVIAIGNGTAGRETEEFVREIGLPDHILVEVVNESGASVYSASEAGREEFPDHDVTVRGAVSIGRRLMDPLSELVKIDPKSIGVGQYQHDVDQSALRQSLDDTVVSCVNGVGVEINTASKRLLTYISGLGPALADNIIHYRKENGPFRSRKELQKIPRLGPKAYEQAAGFLRIVDAVNPLDRTAVHPESYHIVEAMARDHACTVIDLMNDKAARGKIDLNKYVTDTVGLPTLADIVQELARPGRDPRQVFVPFHFDRSVKTTDELRIGMTLPGIVTNVTAFGAFVDIGVHNDGLVHISRLADRFVRDPNEIVRVNQRVTVRVIEIDLERGRIGLSMRSSDDSQ